ncbi:MAG: hypothetical protein P8L41_12775 [Paracoccaceae bacterium]|nr:hypothetical protein [Paracoccaceae bacterium]
MNVPPPETGPLRELGMSENGRLREFGTNEIGMLRECSKTEIGRLRELGIHENGILKKKKTHKTNRLFKICAPKVNIAAMIRDGSTGQSFGKGVIHRFFQILCPVWNYKPWIGLCDFVFFIIGQPLTGPSIPHTPVLFIEVKVNFIGVFPIDRGQNIKGIFTGP